jgi:U3 small nucleolar RNA-associated protein 19
LVSLLEVLEMPFDPASVASQAAGRKPAKAKAFVDSDDEGGDSDDGDKPRKKARVEKKPAVAATKEGRLVAQHNKVFEAAWVAALKLPMRPHTYKRVLLRLPEHVMPFMPTPQRLCDFLTSGYELGGLSSVLALSGLFILMRVHNLDFPGFYPSLYRTLAADVFHAKHRARFFRLLTLCLSSPSLSAHTTAAFVKKLNRLALSAPPSGALYVLALSRNILQKHRDSECMSLIMAPEKGQKGKKDQQGGRPAFDVSAADPELSGALGTSLFELHGLKAHYLPTVAVLAGDMERKWEKREQKLPMDEYTNHTYRELFELERERKAKKVPLSFYKPAGLFRAEGPHQGIFSPL